MLRAFINLKDVVALAQNYTNIPVEVVTVNGSTSLLDQIRIFNSFDVLITPHGSHLANGIFTMKPNSKVVIEVAAFAFDRVFYSNYNGNLMFGRYYISTGHLTPPQDATIGDHCIFQTPTVFAEEGCTQKMHSYWPYQKEVSYYECNEKFHTRMCNHMVDLQILKTHLDDAFDNNICKLKFS